MFPLLLLTPHSPLGPLEPWKALEVFSSLGASVRLKDLVPLASPHSLLLPLAPLAPSSLCPPGTLLGPLEPQEALKVFGSLRALVRLGDLVPLTPLLPLGPSHSPLPLSTPDLPAPWGLSGASRSSGSLGSLW